MSETALEPIASFVKASSAVEADAFATAALLLAQNQLESIVVHENLSLARFSPATNQLWRTKGF